MNPWNDRSIPTLGMRPSPRISRYERGCNRLTALLMWALLFLGFCFAYQPLWNVLVYVLDAVVTIAVRLDEAPPG